MSFFFSFYQNNTTNGMKNCGNRTSHPIKTVAENSFLKFRVRNKRIKAHKPLNCPVIRIYAKKDLSQTLVLRQVANYRQDITSLELVKMASAF